ncbi:MAG TPA: glycosyl hydrolase 53 family protein [Anaerolineales bacterium]|nr:glycosyl hydrolase 53 family protein [Anaerolineales bacterium]
MKNRKWYGLPAVRFGLVAILALIVLLAAGLLLSAKKPSAPPAPGVQVNPIDGLSPDFIMGADVSMLHQIEANGGKYYDNGVQQDALKILKNHGVNWIRLRIWNDPTDANGQGLGGGNNDLATTIGLAKRAKALGFKVLIDFHYSDWWADPSTQTMPKAWVGLTPEELDQAVYAYTADVIRRLAKAGAMPDMVQLGNEINGGMLWPAGATSKQGSAQIGGYDGLAALLQQAAKAVRDNDPNNANPKKRVRIMIHLANGGDNKLYRTVFDELTARNVDFDVIGLSYYSYWHGSLNQLKNNMNDVSQRYHKDVVIAETAYAYTLDNGDGLANLFGESEQFTGGYKATMQGQATAMRDVMAAVAKVPDGLGLGIFYWEPDWIPVEGAGWKAGEGDAWDNQALFDFKGNALPSIDVFNLVRPKAGRTSLQATITEIYPVEIKLAPGDVLKLPATVSALYSDDSINKVVVTWDAVDPSKLNVEGSFAVAGAVAGTDLKASAAITVGGQKNYLNNPGFESGDLTGWVVAGSTNAVDISNETANIHQGAYDLHYWQDGPFEFTVSQTVTGLPNGTYTFSAWIQGGGGEKTLQVFAIDCGGDPLTADIVDTGWQAWQNPAIPNISVTNGQCTVGLKVSSAGGSWAFFDEAGLFQDK